MVVLNELFENKGISKYIGDFLQYALEVSLLSPAQVKKEAKKLNLGMEGVPIGGQVLKIPLPHRDVTRPDGLGLVKKGGNYRVLWAETSKIQDSLDYTMTALYQNVIDKLNKLRDGGAVEVAGGGYRFTREGVAVAGLIVDAEAGYTVGSALGRGLGYEEGVAYPRVQSMLSEWRQAINTKSEIAPLFVAYKEAEDRLTAVFLYFERWPGLDELKDALRNCEYARRP